MHYFQTREEMMRAICKPQSNVCELGVFQGKFAEHLLSLSPRLLVLIDPFEGLVSSGDQDGNNVIHADLPREYERLKRKYDGHPTVHILRGYSQHILPRLKDGAFDVIYIDGDHSYEGVKRDLELSLPKLKRGGFLCGHDYEMNMVRAKNHYDFGVKRAVDEFCSSKGLGLWGKAIDGCVSFAIQN